MTYQCAVCGPLDSADPVTNCPTCKRTLTLVKAPLTLVKSAPAVPVVGKSASPAKPAMTATLRVKA
jgi:hypothetical protein